MRFFGGPFSFNENTLSGPIDLADNKTNLYRCFQNWVQNNQPCRCLVGEEWGRTVAQKEEKKSLKLLWISWISRLLDTCHAWYLSEYTCGRLVQLPKFIYIHASCMSSHVCWRVLVAWIEISHSLCTQIEQNFFFFFVFFLLDAELDLCLKLHPAISYLLSSVRVHSTCFFFFFFNSKGQAFGGHIRSFFSDFQRALECLFRLLVGWIERGTQNSFCTQIEQK
jgi:hypothetical protein